MLGDLLLPGEDLIVEGTKDLSQGVVSIPALLVSIGRPRLTQLGYALPPPIPEAEVRLYQLLAASDEDAAHGRYNALIRRLVSFEHASACAG